MGTSGRRFVAGIWACYWYLTLIQGVWWVLLVGSSTISMLFLQNDLSFVAFFIVRCMASSIIDACNVFATLTSSTGFTVMLHCWMIFRTEIIPRLLIAYKGCMTVMLAVRILISRLRFFEFSRMAGNSINEKFASEWPLMHFLIIER